MRSYSKHEWQEPHSIHNPSAVSTDTLYNPSAVSTDTLYNPSAVQYTLHVQYMQNREHFRITSAGTNVIYTVSIQMEPSMAKRLTVVTHNLQ